MTKIQNYQHLRDQGNDMAFIANVFLTSGGPNCAKTLASLVRLLARGVQITTLSFTMPYDRLLVDGVAVTPEELRQM